MRFQSRDIGGLELFLPVDFLHATLPETTDEYTTIYLEGREVRVLTRVLQMALHFNRTARDRFGDGHDCGVFAWSAHTGKQPDGMRFVKGPGAYRISTTTPVSPIEWVDLDKLAKPGDVVGSYTMEPTDMMDNNHYQVCASAPDRQPQIFFSSPGRAALVGAHTLLSALDAYPATHIGIVTEIEAVPRDFVG